MSTFSWSKGALASFLEGDEDFFSMEEDDNERSSSAEVLVVTVGSMARRQVGAGPKESTRGPRGDGLMLRSATHSIYVVSPEDSWAKE